jgi:hypothetical protein
MPPIALTDQQVMAILAAAHPLARGDRDAFLLEVAQLLQALPEVGDGALHRVIMQVQRRHFDPPQLTDGRAQPHSRAWARGVSALRVAARALFASDPTRVKPHPIWLLPRRSPRPGLGSRTAQSSP